MNNCLVVIDMQNDFIDGSLGTREAQAIVPKVVDKVKNFPGLVLFTRDTHEENYLETQEGRNLPVKHCIYGTDGWQLQKDLQEFADKHHSLVFNKPGFGSSHLAGFLTGVYKTAPIDECFIVGLCTDICVISNAMMLKSALPEMKITVDASCCAGATPEGHKTALAAMKACQINVINEDEGE